MKQHGATLTFPITDNQADKLRGQLGNGSELRKIPAIHYASFSIVPLNEVANLLIELNFDGKFKALIPALASNQIFTEIFEILGIEASDAHKKLSAANQGEGFLFTALPGLSTNEIEANQQLLSAVKLNRNHVDVNNLVTLLSELRQRPVIRNLLCKMKPAKLPGPRNWLAAIWFILGFGFVATLLLGSSVALHPDPFTIYLSSQVAVIVLLVSVIGMVASMFQSAFWKKFIGLMCCSLAFGTIYLSTLINHMSCDNWLDFFVFLGLIFLLIVIRLTLVSPGDFLDRYVANLTISIATALIITVILASIGFKAATLILLALALPALLFLVAMGGPITGPFKLGLLTAIPFVVVVIPMVPVLVSKLAIFALIVLILGVAATVIGLTAFELQERENEEKPALWVPGPRGESVLNQEASRTHHLQHLLSITKIKPGRKWILNLTLRYIFFLESIYGVRGELSGITTIHFARWIVIEDNLIFLSNYDHAWGAYLDEFIDQAAIGLTTIWTHTSGFPLTHWLTTGGAEYAQRFKAYARQSQYPHLSHYARYPTLTVDDIEQAEALKKILLSEKPTHQDSALVARMM